MPDVPEIVDLSNCDREPIHLLSTIQPIGFLIAASTDWIITRPDGCMTLDVRLVLQTDDGALIGLTYRGLRHGPADVMAKVAAGEPVDPALYYFRTAILFETSAPKYDWLNRVFGIGAGSRTASGPEYEIFELL